MTHRSKEHRALRARLVRAAITRHRGSLLTAKAERQAAVLAARTDPEHYSGDAFILGMFHWWRYHFLPAGADQDDFAAACRFLAPVYRSNPQRVPHALRQQFERYERWGQVPGDGPEEHRVRARGLLAGSQRGDGDRKVCEAVELLRAAVAGIPEDDPDRAGFLSDLGAGLRRLWEATGTASALDEAIDAHRAALAAATAGDPDRPAYQHNLGVSLAARYEWSADSAALDEAITFFRAAVAAIPDGDSSRAVMLSGLGSALTWRAGRTKNSDDFAEAVRTLRAAVAVTTARDAELASRQSNLGSALHDMFNLSEDTELLEEAVRAHRSAVAAGPTGQADRAGYLANLAAALTQLAEHTGRAELLPEAIHASREAVAATPAPDPRRAEYLVNLGYMLQSRGSAMPDASLLDEAARCLQEAAGSTARAFVRVRACQLLAHLADGRDRHRDALAAMEAAVTLLPHIVPGSLARRDREHQLGSLAGLAGDAAAAAIGAGRADRAVELLEQARGILTAEALLARSSDLAALAESSPPLVHAFRQAQDRLAAADGPPATGSPVPVLSATARATSAARPAGVAAPATAPRAAAPLPGHGPEHSGAAERPDAEGALDQVVDRIRTDSMPGFLRTPRLAQLTAAIAGPVVYVCAGLSRCDALIVRPGEPGTAEAVLLPGLTKAEAYRQAGKFAQAQVTVLETDAPASIQQQARADMLAVLAWAWDAIAAPALDALGHTLTPSASGDWPRVWWCPVGPLAFLPLHAAGHHDDLTAQDPARAAQPRTVLDRVVSSYAITLRSLTYACAQRPGPASQPMLIVAVPQAPGLKPLTGAEDEAREITSLVTSACIHSGAQALHDEVLAAIPQHAIAHFACHGYADMTDPGASFLALQDHQAKPLTVRDISAVRLDSGLAYLSACETGRTPPELTDEAVHITGAFHLAGYQHVIGTLWPVLDKTAGRLAANFYRRLTSEGTLPPRADLAANCLHQAVRDLRTRHPGAPEYWAAYTHTGP